MSVYRSNVPLNTHVFVSSKGQTTEFNCVLEPLRPIRPTMFIVSVRAILSVGRLAPPSDITKRNMDCE